MISYWITGFPPDRLSTADGATEDLIPGDSVTLYHVTGTSGPSGPADTLRAVNWAVTSGGVVRITPGPEGSVALVAVTPGDFYLTVNGKVPLKFACGPSGCTMITLTRVVAPPTPSVR